MARHRHERSLNDLKLTHCGAGTTKSQPFELVARALSPGYALRRETHSARNRSHRAVETFADAESFRLARRLIAK
jgi:hypothetical protein